MPPERRLPRLRDDRPRDGRRPPGRGGGRDRRTAAWKDAAAALKSNLAPVIAFVLLFAFALMLVAFRSIVVATKAIVLNLLS
jgi:RND superfamily putative drug exporter